MTRTGRAGGSASPASFVFAGRREGTHLAERTAQTIARQTARAANVSKAVTPTALRDSFAVHALEGGASIREVQEWLGHERLTTTMRYAYCVLPRDAASPLDLLCDGTAPRAGAPAQDRDGVPFDSVLQGVPTPEDLDAVLTPDGPSISFFAILRTHLWGRFLAPRRGG